MLVVFPPIFLADTKIINGYNFVAPLNDAYLIDKNTCRAVSSFSTAPTQPTQKINFTKLLLLFPDPLIPSRYLNGIIKKVFLLNLVRRLWFFEQRITFIINLVKETGSESLPLPLLLSLQKNT